MALVCLISSCMLFLSGSKRKPSDGASQSVALGVTTSSSMPAVERVSVDDEETETATKRPKRATECGLDTKKGISLDVSTRWNSTYLMLSDALYYRSAFMRLKSSNRRRYKKISPSSDEWDMAIQIFQCLKKFYDLTEILSGTSYPTTNLFL